MRFLCLSDIHGHAAALRAVIAEAQNREFHQIVVCGDHLFPGPEPLETWKLLVDHRALCVQGVGDRAIALVDPDDLMPENAEHSARLDRLVTTKAALGELIVARLGKLPDKARLPLENGDEMLIVHGAPADPTEALSFDMTDEEMNALIGDDPADFIVCGASHVPFVRQLDGVHVINVGSVGEAPGGRVAHATFVDANSFGVSVDQFEVELD